MTEGVHALPLPIPSPAPVLAVGAQQKSSFTLAAGSEAWLSSLGADLETLEVYEAFASGVAQLEERLGMAPTWVAHDLHPGYLSTRFATERSGAAERIGVQHHHAHIASAAAEHGISEPVIGVAYDGLGMGDDGTFWGGELLIADLRGHRRFGRFARAPMPGGAAAVLRPCRMALGYLLGAEAVPGGEALEGVPAACGRLATRAGVDAREVEVIRTQVERGLNAPLASSAGRLFDAASALLGICAVASYPAEAAIELQRAAEAALETLGGDLAGIEPLPYRLDRVDGLVVFDVRPTLAPLATFEGSTAWRDLLALRFHATIAAVTRELCAEARRETGLDTVVLSGGVFQNGLLRGHLLDALAADGFRVVTNDRVPASDAGISYGQAAVAAARLAAGIAKQ